MFGNVTDSKILENTLVLYSYCPEIIISCDEIKSFYGRLYPDYILESFTYSPISQHLSVCLKKNNKIKNNN